MSKRLDAKDHALLTLLARDARQPVVALARALGLSRSATQERLQRLEASGVIQGYTVRTRLENGPCVQAWLRLKFKPGVSCSDVTPSVLRAAKFGYATASQARPTCSCSWSSPHSTSSPPQGTPLPGFPE